MPKIPNPFPGAGEMTQLEHFLVALEDWQEANREYHAAKDKYDGYSPDYHLYREREKLRLATANLGVEFKNAVQEAMSEVSR